MEVTGDAIDEVLLDDGDDVLVEEQGVVVATDFEGTEREKRTQPEPENRATRDDRLEAIDAIDLELLHVVLEVDLREDGWQRDVAERMWIGLEVVTLCDPTIRAAPLHPWASSIHRGSYIQSTVPCTHSLLSEHIGPTTGYVEETKQCWIVRQTTCL